MMLRVSFLLLSMVAGAAPTMGQSLFSRESILCFGSGEDNAPTDPPAPNSAPVDTPPDGTRTCSTLVGDGLCIDSKDDVYPVCLKESVTLQDCQKAAADTSDALGVSHGSYEDDNGATVVQCILWYDRMNTGFTCPDETWEKYIEKDYTEGTGPIRGSDFEPGAECYTCALDFKPVTPPLTTRTCSPFGPGSCTDSLDNEYPFCYKYTTAELCEKRTAQNGNAIGFTYYEGCYMYFDANDDQYECPAGYVPDGRDPPEIGTGEVRGTSTMFGGVCHVCQA